MKNLSKETLKIYWQHSMRYKGRLFVIVILVGVHIILTLYFPILYKKLLDQMMVTYKRSDLGPLMYIVWTIFIVSMIRQTAARAFNYLNNYFQLVVMRDLYNTIFSYVHRHSMTFFSNTFVGSLVTKAKRYERSYEIISDQIIFESGRLAVETVIILFLLTRENSKIGLIVLIWLIIYLVFSYLFTLYRLPVELQRSAIDSQVSGQMADTIANNVNIKAFSALSSEKNKFARLIQSQYLIRKKSWELITHSDGFQAVSMIVMEFFVLQQLVHLWGLGLITIGSVALVQSYLMRMFDKYWNVGKFIRQIFEAFSDANEMTEILLTPHGIQDVPNAGQLATKNGEIDFQNVGFSYGQAQEVLTDFSLKIKPKEKVAIVGPSGGGKTTIVKLLFRFYDIQKGAISIDGQNIGQVTQDSLRQALSLVPQEPILFHRSLLENIRYGKPEASDEEVIEASKLAHAHEFITGFPDSYRTLVGERGVKLSGGERQRVAIARAILKNSPILVLDEATSSLDSESEMYIQDALKKLMQDKTVIVIAHRLSTIMQMDRIVVIENGKVVEQGKHEELVKASQGLYQKLWEIQAGAY